MSNLVILPEVEEINEVIDKIYQVSKQIARLKLAIKIKEAEVALEKSQEGKISMAFLQATYVITGKENEITKLRTELAKLEPELEYYRNKLEMYKMIVDIWRTQSANERNKAL